MIEKLKEYFPHIPEKALLDILNIQSRNLINHLSSRGIFRPKKVTVKGLGTFIIGGKVAEKKYVKRKNKVSNKGWKKWYKKKKESTIDGLL